MYSLDRPVEPNPEQIEVHVLAVDRVADQLLEDNGRACGGVELEVDDGAGVRKRMAQLTAIDRKCDRVLAASIEDAGDLAFAAQAARIARAGGLATRCRERRGGLVGHRGGRW
jgi:hypothetical protein